MDQTMIDNIKIVNLFPNDERVSVRTIQPDLKRDWMEASDEKYAYRCLPLNVANQHGLAVYPNSDISVVWNGGKTVESINIIEGGGITTSVFRDGILTFHLPFLVRTPKGYSVYITGCPNHPIDNAYALTGVFESDWAPYSFTMNWKLTSVNNIITFKKTDPICFFFPVERDALEKFEYISENIEDQEEDYRKQYYNFVLSRDNFLNGSSENKEGWQKNYFQGKNPDGTKCPFDNHKTKIRIDVKE
jgi:hypothetical protein